MTKNEKGLTVTVLDSNGIAIGKTYPKRAKGLIKKGRAQLVSDNQIRLDKVCPTYENTEEIKMDNNVNNTSNTATTETTIPKDKDMYLFFDPKAWYRDPDVGGSVERFFITSPIDESLLEVWSISGWLDGNLSGITSGLMALEKNTKYHFLFWLNGGENDKRNETCQCQIMFSHNNIRVDRSDWDNKMTYNLNRNYIKPVKQYMGWRLYDITFTTQDKAFTQICLVARNAPTAFMAAEKPECYTMEDVLDEFAERRPQRHNIVFDDGWPTNTWYSTIQLREQMRRSQSADGQNQLNQDMVNEIVEGLAYEIDLGDLAAEIAASLDLSEISQQVAERLAQSSD